MSDLSKPREFIPFFTDFGFKATFGNEKLDVFLKYALPILVGRSSPLRTVERLQNDLTPNTPEGKSSRLDLLCTDEQGDIYVVEMQLEPQSFFFERMVFYACQQFVNQFNRGDQYDKEIPTVYSVGISYKDIWEDGLWYDQATIKSENGATRTEKLVFITIELTKFDKQVSTPSTPLEEFVYMLKHLQDFDSMQQLPNFTVSSWMKGAFEELRMANLSPQQYAKAEADIIWLRDKLTTDKRNKAHYFNQGVEHERAIAKERLMEQAKAMKIDGLLNETIAKYTGLPISVIESL